MTVIANRYKVLEELGRGGMGVVYRVADTLNGDAEVALKVIRSQGPVPAEVRLRFQEEFRAMLKLRHPNTLEVHDYGQVDDATQFLTMEVVPGTDLEALLGEGPLTVDQGARVLAQLLHALGFIHGRLYVHRDIKAGNLRLRPDGTVKLMDFGLMDRLGIRSSANLTGTVGYMAPEVPRGGVIEAASDLYSVGCLAYELLTGRLPFQGEIVQVVRAHMNLPPTPPRALRPEIPRGLEEIVLRLLAKDPRERFQQAVEVLDALEDLAIPGLVGLGREQLDVRRSYLVSSVLVGRDAELGVLDAALGALTEGRGAAVLVGAPAGVGKTRLAHEALLKAKLEHLPVLQAVCREAGIVPYGPLAEALAGLVPLATPDELATHGAALARVVPALQALGIEPAPPVPASQDKLRIAAAVVGWLRSASRRQPLVLFLDDLHWADENTLEVLNRVVREVTDAPVFVLATFRNDEAPPTSPIWTSVREGLARHLKIAPLTLPQMYALLQAQLHEFEIGQAFGQHLFHATGGNAFFLTELLRYLMEEGWLTRQGGRWRFPVSIEGVHLPTSVGSTVLRRLAHLGPVARAVASVAATMGRQLDVPALIELAGLDEEALFAALDELIERQLLIRDEQGYSFPHDRVREALYEDQDLATRQDLHQRYGELLERRGGDSLTHALAYHFARGRDPRKALEHLTRAGQLGRQEGAPGMAVAYLREAARCLEALDIPDKPMRQLRLWSDIATIGGEAMPQAITPYLEMKLALLEGQGGSVAYARLRGGGVRLVGDLRGARHLRFPARRSRLRRRLAALGFSSLDAWQRAVAEGYAFLTGVYGQAGDHRKGLETFERARKYVPPTARTLAATLAIGSCTSLLRTGELDELAVRCDRVQELLRDEPMSPWALISRATLAIRNSVSFQGVRPDEGLVERCVALADSAGQTSYRNAHAFLVGVWYAYTGRGDAALELADRIARHTLQIGASSFDWAFQRRVNYLRPLVHLQRGDLDDALRLLDQALASPAAEVDGWSRELLRVVRGQVVLERGEVTEARADFERALQVGEAEGLGVVAMQALIGQGACGLADGDHDGAARALERAIARAREGRFRNPLHEAIASRLLAQLAARSGRTDEAHRHLAHAMQIVTQPEQDNLLEQGRLLQDQGDLLRDAGDPQAALFAYGEAAERFRTLGNRHLLRSCQTRIEPLERRPASVSPDRPGWPRSAGEVTRIEPPVERPYAVGPLGTSEAEHQELLSALLDAARADEGSLFLLEPTVRWLASRRGEGPAAELPVNPRFLDQVRTSRSGLAAIDVPEVLLADPGSRLEVALPSVLVVPLGAGQAVAYLVRHDLADPFEEPDLRAFVANPDATAAGPWPIRGG